MGILRSKAISTCIIEDFPLEDTADHRAEVNKLLAKKSRQKIRRQLRRYLYAALIIIGATLLILRT
tara:strand:- start:629 stop:826 length:198 start_codon:yes stop_codon:yes gene_type:complete